MPRGWDRKEVAGPLGLCWILLLSVLVGQSLSGSCGPSVSQLRVLWDLI